MENPERTRQYRAVLAGRKSNLIARFDQILSSGGNLVWEIGCGHGHFLTAFAQSHPDQICVGIDISTERIERAQRKRDHARLSNLHFIQAEARLFLETLPAPARFSTIFVLFPDPWPKLRHQKHRILQPDFLLAMAQRALPSTRLYFRTDFQPYFAEVAGCLGPAVGWEQVDEPWPFDFETVFQSRAEIFNSLAARPINAGVISLPPPKPDGAISANSPSPGSHRG